MYYNKLLIDEMLYDFYSKTGTLTVTLADHDSVAGHNDLQLKGDQTTWTHVEMISIQLTSWL